VAGGGKSRQVLRFEVVVLYSHHFWIFLPSLLLHRIIFEYITNSSNIQMTMNNISCFNTCLGIQRSCIWWISRMFLQTVLLISTNSWLFLPLSKISNCVKFVLLIQISIQFSYISSSFYHYNRAIWINFFMIYNPSIDKATIYLNVKSFPFKVPSNSCRFKI